MNRRSAATFVVRHKKSWCAKGGKTTAARRTALERTAAARKAVMARWKRYRQTRGGSA